VTLENVESEFVSTQKNLRNSKIISKLKMLKILSLSLSKSFTFSMWDKVQSTWINGPHI
jgi:hypothetical protein